MRPFSIARPPLFPLLLSVATAGALLLGPQTRLGQLHGSWVLLATWVGLCAVGWRISSILGTETLPGRLTAATVAATSVATLIVITLGHFGLLRPAHFLAALACAVVVTIPLSRPREADGPGDAAATPHRLERIAGRLAVGFATALVLSTLHAERAAPPGAFGGDDNSFHLAGVATWIDDNGGIPGLKLSYGDPATAFYPLGGEAVSWALLAPSAATNDFAARWSQLPFFLASLAAIASIALRLGVDRWGALFAALLYASIRRVFPELALGAGNDHLTAFATLATVDFLLAWVGRWTAGPSIALGLAIGLLVGTKYLGLLLLGPLLGVGLVLVVLRRQRPSDRPAWRGLMVASGAALLIGGYWYLRNAVTCGNPIFPQPLSIAGLELPGRESVSLAARLTAPESAIEVTGFLFHPGRFGALARWLLTPAALLAPVAAAIAAWRLRSQRDPALRARFLANATAAAVLTLPCLLFAEFLMLVPDRRDSRYLLAAIALACVAAAFILHRSGALGPRARTTFGALGFAALAAQTLATQPQGSWWPPIAAAAGAVALRRTHLPRWPLRPAPALICAALAGISWAWMGATIDSYPSRKLDRLPEARALEEITGGHRADVAYLGHNLPYPFWGSRLQNDVYLVPRIRRPGARLYRWGGSVADPFAGRGSYRTWNRNLNRLGIDYLVVDRTGDPRPERDWMTERPERFELMRPGSIEIWRLAAPRGPVTAGSRRPPARAR